MNTVTHALLPIVAICGYQRLKPEVLSLTKWHLFFVGLLGAAPDLLNPHLSLQSRYQSWSHSVIAWFGVTILFMLMIVVLPKRVTRTSALLMSLAYLLHLVCDALSGGIAWLQPFSHDILGAYYISPALWIPLDVFLILIAYVHFRTRSPDSKI